MPLAVLVAPVAQQSDASIQVTALMMLAGVDGLGLGVTVQAEPSQCSARVVDGLPLASMVDPIARQFDVPVQVTEDRY